MLSSNATSEFCRTYACIALNLLMLPSLPERANLPSVLQPLVNDYFHNYSQIPQFYLLPFMVVSMVCFCLYQLNTKTVQVFEFEQLFVTSPEPLPPQRSHARSTQSKI